MRAGPATTTPPLAALSPNWPSPVQRAMPPEVMLLAVAAIWGGSYALAKQVTLHVLVLQYLALRFGLTALLLTPALLKESAQAAQDWGWARAIGLGVLLMGIFFAETLGVTLTSATHAAFLVSLCVAITPLTEWLILRRRPGARVMWAVVLCVVGAGLLSPGAFVQPLTNLGDGLMLLAALLRALMVTTTRHSAARIRMPAIVLTAVQSWVVFVGALVALAVFTPATELRPLPAEPTFWFALLFLVLFCTIFAFYAQNHAASRTSPTRVSFLMGSEPVFGALFGWLMFGDRLAPIAWVGCALILVATYIVALAPLRAPRIEPSPA
jgi:drug/metabolite transporter (DMT)-like permease